MNYCVFANQGDFQIQIEQFLKRLYKSSLRTITSKVKGKAFIKFFRFWDIFIIFATFPTQQFIWCGLFGGVTIFDMNYEPANHVGTDLVEKIKGFFTLETNKAKISWRSAM